MLRRRCRRRAIYWLLRSPSQTCHAKPKLKSTGAGRYQLLSRWWDAYRKRLPERLLSEKSGRCGIPSRLRSAALSPLWLIVVISVRQSTVAAISGLHCRALVMVSLRRLTAWLQNLKKRVERSERLMYEQSHRDYSRSGYLHHRLPVMGC